MEGYGSGSALAAQQNYAGDLLRKQAFLESPTLSQNIDRRIADMQQQIARLNKVRDLLEKGLLLEVPIEDLRFAMSY